MNDRTEELNRLVEEWTSAELRGDTAFLERSLADDFVGVGPLGFMLTKEQWLGRFAGGLAYESFAIDELEARFYGHAAVATCRQKQTGEFRGNDVSGEFRVTLVFAEIEGSWLLAGWHASPIAGAPSFLDR
jgi:ketosteroid isomerase-like protein